jgi:catechol 2,3-dioxygenase
MSLLPADTAVREVTLRSADVERAAAFYREIAGLEDLGDGALGWKGSPLIRLVGVAGGRAPVNAAGLFHTALRYSDRAALGQALRRAVESGLLTGASDHGVSEALYLDDPDGNGVELYFDRPREVWPPPSGPDDKVGMFTAPLDLDDLRRTGDAAPPSSDGTVDIGHVHFKVSDLPRAVGFWRDALGLDLMARYGDQAAFLAAGGYHHHVGLNVWHSRGASLGPVDLPGLEEARFGVSEAGIAEARERLEAAGAAVADANGGVASRDPDGVALVLDPA